MLAFLRTYQKYFFVVITFVIVVSFTFFGTYNGMQKGQFIDKEAFTSLDGRKIGRHEVEEMILFLGTDAEDKLLLGGMWGPNFLNDGVVKKDFLATGLAQKVVASHLTDLQGELATRAQKERNYRLYEHPGAKFLSVPNAWNLVAPEMQGQFERFQQFSQPATADAFDARVQLFNSQRRFPHPALRYVLRHQQKQYSWIEPDPNLERIDLALFGYHTVNDWFGSRFMHLVAQAVINGAAFAEEQGYEVSRSEVIADLYRNAELSFRQNADNPNVGVTTSEDYLKEQLRRMGMDTAKAVKVWRQVMLFRRVFQDVGSAVLIDPMTVAQLHGYAKESVEGDLYTVQRGVQIGDFATLQKFELYLDSVAQRPNDLLALPKNFKPPQEVVVNTPELAQRRYLVKIASVNKRMLEAKVGVKETWDWEVREGNWQKLQQEFPGLAEVEATNEEGRYAALNRLAVAIRQRVDSFARAAIVDLHSEWLDQALREADEKEEVLAVPFKGRLALIPQEENPVALMELLDNQYRMQQPLEKYSPDGKMFYRITVVDRGEDAEILTFAEAEQRGVLDLLLTALLEKEYQQQRRTNPAPYRNSDGSWKPINQVRYRLGERLFADILAHLKELHKEKIQDGQSGDMLADYIASFRLHPIVDGIRRRLQENPAAAASFVLDEKKQEKGDGLPVREPPFEQWKLEKSTLTVDRGAKNRMFDVDQLFGLQKGEWSKVLVKPNGGLGIFRLERRFQGEDRVGLNEKILEMQELLSIEAQQQLMEDLLQKIEVKGAITLDYLKMTEQ